MDYQQTSLHRMQSKNLIHCLIQMDCSNVCLSLNCLMNLSVCLSLNLNVCLMSLNVCLTNLNCLMSLNVCLTNLNYLMSLNVCLMNLSYLTKTNCLMMHSVFLLQVLPNAAVQLLRLPSYDEPRLLLLQ